MLPGLPQGSTRFFKVPLPLDSLPLIELLHAVCSRLAATMSVLTPVMSEPL